MNKDGYYWMKTSNLSCDELELVLVELNGTHNRYEVFRFGTEETFFLNESDWVNMQPAIVAVPTLLEQ